MTRLPTHLVLTLLLWLAGLGAAGQFSKIAVPFALFQQHYPGAQVGWLLSVVSFVGVLFGMVASIFVVRFGPFRSLIFALSLGALISWRQAALPDLTEMIGLRLIEGLSHLTIVVAAPTLIGTQTPANWRGFAMTLWSSFFGVAFALTAVFGLPFAEAQGVGDLLRWHAVWMGVLAVIFMVLSVKTSDRLQDSAKLEPWSVYLSAYRSPWIVAPAWGWLFYTTTFVSGLAILPLLVAEEKQQSLITAMPLLSIFVSMVLLPILLRRYSAVAMIITGFVLAALVVFASFLALPLHILALYLFGVLGLVQGASFAAIPQLNTSTQAQALANGTMAQAGNLGNLIGTPLLLWILGMAGETGLFLSFAALYLLGALAHLVLMRRRSL